ncbi:MAG: prolyl oligopeptidase family serine peptidase [Chloroherpetonaceae bacterium]|nr:prolyl oligopeptidase family serine peptidase [Chloroherpetonaceae bacterium]
MQATILRLRLALTLLALLTMSQSTFAQGSTGYKMPPKAIADLVDAPPTPAVSLSPNRTLMLILERPSLPPISELAAPEYRLAGLRINPRTNGPSRASYFTKLVLRSIDKPEERVISGLPSEARITNVRWSPNGAYLAFTLTRSNSIELWLANVATASAKKLINAPLNDAFGPAFVWLPDSKGLIVKLISDKRGKEPLAPAVPTGPVIQETSGKTAAAPTFQDLLKNAHDEALFEYFLASKLAQVSLSGALKPIAKEGLIATFQPSPNGKYLLVETLHRPFSYLVPAARFPKKIEVLDLTGKLVKEIADLPLAEDIPLGRDAARKGVRNCQWRPDAPATLYWVEAQDNGDPKVKAEVRDKLFVLAEPFTDAPKEIAALTYRFQSALWSETHFALISETWWLTRKIRTWKLMPDVKDAQPDLLFDRSFEDRYSDPGEPVMKMLPNGFSVLHLADGGNALLMIGEGASPEGDKPFLDKFNLTTKKAERLWQSAAPYYEYPIDVLDEASQRIVTSRESQTDPPNYFVRNLSDNTLTALTNFPHPAPALAKVQKELIKYKREDGVELSATLYTPEGWTPEKGPLPMLMWAYPREFKSAQAASQVVGSPYRFTRINWGSPLFWLTQGYAILDGPTMPIVGEGGKEPNDTYIPQLVASAKAAVEEVVRRGVADRRRIAIGGHSYGAFMTANLLAHSDLFRAGIARSGAYNRTLTPFGFQNEERTLWQAPETYIAMSPFMHADKINEPILLIHGEADNNQGTFPIQTERFFNALKGLGKTARMVLLPHESHGYQARESVMHMLYEMHEWLEKYVKNADTKTSQLD